ncbi:replication initiation protein (plasmid) [Xenorhabdus stockiae]|uniref:replication initiation protein n=1 Tax=Xenorhabdus stockiae TaxID=351614 RepID=UPI003CF7590F
MSKIMSKKVKVKQSNELTEAAYYLSLKAKRVLWLCLMQIYSTFKQDGDELYEVPIFAVKVSDYESLFGVSRNQSGKDVKDAIMELSRSNVVFHPKEGRYDCITRPWLAEAGSRSSRGIWEIEFNHKLLPYIYGLTNQFTTYSLHDCGSLRNPRTVRLYECLIQFRSSGVWVTTHDWLSERFVLPNSQRANLAEMKRSFLDPALKQINEKTPLKVNYNVDNSGKFLFMFTDKNMAKSMN